MKPLVVGLLLAGALVACRSVDSNAPVKLAPGTYGDGSVLSGGNGEALFPSYPYSCGDKSWSYDFGEHVLIVRYSSSLWYWHSEPEGGSDGGLLPGSYPMGQVSLDSSLDGSGWSGTVAVGRERGGRDGAMVGAGCRLVL